MSVLGLTHEHMKLYQKGSTINDASIPWCWFPAVPEWNAQTKDSFSRANHTGAHLSHCLHLGDQQNLAPSQEGWTLISPSILTEWKITQSNPLQLSCNLTGCLNKQEVPRTGVLCMKYLGRMRAHPLSGSTRLSLRRFPSPPTKVLIWCWTHVPDFFSPLANLP